MSPAVASQCFMLTNMFDPLTESQYGWTEDIKKDVIEKCQHHGAAIVHIHVCMKSREGIVYVKCSDVKTAIGCVNALHHRWYGGRRINAAYVPVVNYHNLFGPD